MKRISTKFKSAYKKARGLGYKNMNDLDKNGTKEHKKLVKKAYM